MYIFSSITILIVFTGVNPDKFSVFGLEFPDLNLSVLNGVLLFLLGYSIVVFFVYGLSDYFRFRHRFDVYNIFWATGAYNAMSEDPGSYNVQQRQSDQEDLESMTGHKPLEIPFRRMKAFMYIRVAIIDLIFPLVIGVVSMVLFILLHVLG